MRTRRLLAGVATIVLLASLSACGGSDDKPSAPMTEYKISCDEFDDTAKKVTDAQAQIYGGATDSKALDDLVAQLDALERGAPDDVKAAIVEMEGAFRQAQAVMQEQKPDAAQKLSELAPKLSADSQKITAYVVAKCK